eukprot:5135053-Amphidinium_carterae.1
MVLLDAPNVWSQIMRASACPRIKLHLSRSPTGHIAAYQVKLVPLLPSPTPDCRVTSLCTLV